MQDAADKIIAKLGLQRHPEGGWYRETWRGPEIAGSEIAGSRVAGPDGAAPHGTDPDGARPEIARAEGRRPVESGRASGTAILFLLRAGERSHWHRVDADEIWLWHAGAPLILSMGESCARDHRLGPDVLGGDSPQIVVPKGWWQAAVSTGDWTLVSCTVSPGFRFEGFELAAPEWDLPREG